MMKANHDWSQPCHPCMSASVMKARDLYATIAAVIEGQTESTSYRQWLDKRGWSELMVQCFYPQPLSVYLLDTLNIQCHNPFSYSMATQRTWEERALGGGGRGGGGFFLPVPLVRGREVERGKEEDRVMECWPVWVTPFGAPRCLLWLARSSPPWITSSSSFLSKVGH